MAVSYVQIGQWAEALGWSVNAGEIHTIAGQLRPSSDIYTRQGMAFLPVTWPIAPHKRTNVR